MKISKEKLRKILKEELNKVLSNTNMMEDMFDEKEKEYWTRGADKRAKPTTEQEERLYNTISAADAFDLGSAFDPSGEDKPERLDQDLEDTTDESEQSKKEEILKIIESDAWQKNDRSLPAAFLSSQSANQRAGFMSPYSIKELSELRLFKVPGSNAGFAIKPDGDIIAVHNSSGVRGLGRHLLVAAIRNGGTKLDHFDGFLSKFYESFGFIEYERWEWDDQYAPEDWDYEEYGRPAVVLRRLRQEEK